MKKKIYVVTGSRADYGLLKILLNKFRNDKKVDLKILVTGMHLLPDFGSTFKEIIKDGFKINKNKLNDFKSFLDTEFIKKRKNKKGNQNTKPGIPTL